METPGSVSPRSRSVNAPAKINLSLHVLGRRADGYHELDGLVVFAEDGDRLIVSEASHDALVIDGPMASGLSTLSNLVLDALALVREIAAAHGIALEARRIRLTKNLPVAAGLGGGSADAAALLRAVVAQHPTIGADVRRACVRLGADVPMCFDSGTAHVSGIGDRIVPVPSCPSVPLLLLNPGVAISTAAVFKGLGAHENAPSPTPPAGGFENVGALLEYCERCRNDLEPPALALAPVIADALDAARGTGALFSRMSGSGATVFAIYESEEAAASAGRAIRERHPAWWVLATRTRTAGVNTP